MVNVIADIAGQYKTLLALLDKMPDDEPVSVGDLVDRGPQSKEVLEFFMNNGRAIMGNHEHMMLDTCFDRGYYSRGIWQMNGGDATLKSFGASDADVISWGMLPRQFVPDEVLEWVGGLPLYLEIDDCLISHSFPDGDLKAACELGKSIDDAPHSIIWNRYEPERLEGYNLQIAGHNSQFSYRWFSDDQGDFAVCLDDSRNRVLTGMHLPSRKIYQQEYIG